MSALVIEPMAARHIDAVLAIDAASYSKPWSAKHWRDELAADDRHHLVGRIDDDIVAHAGTLLVVDELHVVTVASHPDHRGRGHATRLVLELLRAGSTAGATATTLEVRARDRGAQRLYARFGFVPAGVRSAYYSAPIDDAVIMWLHDLDGPEARARIERVADAIDEPVKDRA